MQTKRKKQAQQLYLILAAIFIAALVACNLIFQKFFTWTPLEWLDANGNPSGNWYVITHYTFEISVGILPYPITFLATDMISEIFGRRKANNVVIAGLIASIFVFGIILISDAVPATSWSPVSDNEFTHVFGRTGLAVISSMIAYLIAQFIDIRIFHFWKRVTHNKKLWVRNNFSTISSQCVDTSTVLLLLCFVGVIEWHRFWQLFINGFLFKSIIALLDTPVFYMFTYWARNHFNLKPGQEIPIDY